MLRRLTERKALDDRVTAHLAHGLATGRLVPIEARGAKFACFSPPLDAHAFADALAGGHVSSVLVDDTSLTARVFAMHRQPPKHAPAAPPPAVPPPPPYAHPLQHVVDRIAARLAAIGVPWSRWLIDERASSPLLRFDGKLYLAARHPRIIGELSDDAVDAIAAHAVTVLNVALTEITDVSEAHALANLLTAPGPASRSP